MNKLLWVSSSHRVEIEKEFSKYFCKYFSVLLLPDIKIEIKKKLYKNAIVLILKSIKINTFFDLRKINYITLIAICLEDLKNSKFNFIRLSWFIFRVFWIANFNITQNDIFIFRGINDPLIKYLRLIYKENIIYLLPHGTDFCEPFHYYWKYSNYWVTDYKNFYLGNSSIKILYFGRLEYSQIKRKKVINKVLTPGSLKRIGLILPHTNKKLIDYQLEKIKKALNFCNIEAEIFVRPHPGDFKLLHYLKKNELYLEKNLDDFINFSDILLFPVGHYGWVSNLYYECCFKGYISAAIVNDLDYKYIKIKNLIFDSDQNILKLKNDSFLSWFNNIKRSGYSNESVLRKFYSSNNMKEKLLTNFLAN